MGTPEPRSATEIASGISDEIADPVACAVGHEQRVDTPVDRDQTSAGYGPYPAPH